MNAFLIIIYVIIGLYVVINFKHDLHMFQQNSYRIPRYWKWLKSGDTASNWRLIDVACLFLLCSTLLFFRLSALIVACVCLAKIAIIFRKKYKKPLVFTKRVWRLYAVTALLATGIYLAVILLTNGKLNIFGNYSPGVVSIATALLLAIFSWVILIIADIILIPVEKMIQNRYINQAKKILKEMPDLKIIGVTGSYGKTTTKHYLNRILSEKYNVLMTPGSYNTPMGVVRTIRELMKPYNEVFICEMGAKQKGDIREICDIVHPQTGIVTAVGPMHLESFKSIENVQSTKFELIDSLPSDGLAVINNDFEFCANREVGNVKVIRYGITNTDNCQYTASDITYTPNGTTFTINGPDNFKLEVETRIVGECNISNILGASVIALNMGVEPSKIKYAISCIEQVEHRLSIKQTPGGVTIIDDAFNSNPTGSKMAIDVLSHFNKDGKRIVITPGMIELGTQQFNLNKELGKYMVNKVDVIIIVGQYNHDAIEEGVKETDFDLSNLHSVASFNEAQALLGKILTKGDTVLYENDLPDTFK